MRRVLRMQFSLYSPNKKLITLGATLLNRPRALLSVLQPVARRNINLSSVVSSAAETEDESTTVAIVLDVTNVGDEELKSVIEELRSNEKVLSMEIFDAEVPGLAVDFYHTRNIECSTYV